MVSLTDSQYTTEFSKSIFEASTKLRCHHGFVKLTLNPNMHLDVAQERKIFVYN